MSSIDSSKRLHQIGFMVADIAPIRDASKAWDIRTLAAVRTMYLVQGLQPSEIEASGLGLTARQVSQLALREGWTKSRQLAVKRGEETARAALANNVARVSEAIAIESEELCFSALRETRAGLTEGGLNGAKQAQAASSTLRNLAGVAQAIRKPELAQAGQGVTNTNIFFSLAAPNVAEKQPENVTEISASVVK